MAEIALSILKLPQVVVVVALAQDRVVQVALAAVVVVLAPLIQAAQVYLGRATMAARAVMRLQGVAMITQAVGAAVQVRLAL
jgi:hypothetical protein